MSRPRGSIIGAKPTWTTTATSGIWTLRQAEEMKAAGQWPRGPVAPTSLAGTAGDGQAALTWVAPATTHGTITDYVVEYTPAAGSPTVVATGSTAASYTLTGLTNDTEYTFRVASMNHTRGDWSDSVAVTPSSVSTDPDFASVSLLLHADGADGSTTFADSSSSGLTVTAAGNATVSTTQAKFGQSLALDGSGDYLDLPNDSLLTMGTGDFTIEFWLYVNNVSSSASGNHVLMTGESNAVLIAFRNTNQLSVGSENIAFLIDGSLPSEATWTHLAVSRSSGSMRLFLDGVQAGSTYSSSVNFSSPQRRIGAKYTATGQFFDGYIDDVRITKGVGRYTSTFTPPTAAFSGPSDPEFANVSLLLHMDGSNGSTTFTDSSSNAFTGTRYGSLAVSTTESKFGGASAAFSGGTSQDALDFADNAAFDFGTGDFTLECWAYLNGTPSNVNALIAKYGNGGNEWIWWVNNSGKLMFYTDGGSVTSGASVPTGQWTFLSVTRQSGTVKVFIGGAQEASGTISTDFNGSATLSVGNYPAFGSFNSGFVIAVDGYLDDVRITKGVARYTAAFTPPTAPFPDQ